MKTARMPGAHRPAGDIFRAIFRCGFILLLLAPLAGCVSWPPPENWKDSEDQTGWAVRYYYYKYRSSIEPAKARQYDNLARQAAERWADLRLGQIKSLYGDIQSLNESRLLDALRELQQPLEMAPETLRSELMRRERGWDAGKAQAAKEFVETKREDLRIPGSRVSNEWAKYESSLRARLLAIRSDDMDRKLRQIEELYQAAEKNLEGAESLRKASFQGWTKFAENEEIWPLEKRPAEDAARDAREKLKKAQEGFKQVNASLSDQRVKKLFDDIAARRKEIGEDHMTRAGFAERLSRLESEGRRMRRKAAAGERRAEMEAESVELECAQAVAMYYDRRFNQSEANYAAASRAVTETDARYRELRKKVVEYQNDAEWGKDPEYATVMNDIRIRLARILSRSWSQNVWALANQRHYYAAYGKAKEYWGRVISTGNFMGGEPLSNSERSVLAARLREVYGAFLPIGLDYYTERAARLNSESNVTAAALILLRMNDEMVAFFTGGLPRMAAQLSELAKEKTTLSTQRRDAYRKDIEPLVSLRIVVESFKNQGGATVSEKLKGKLVEKCDKAKLMGVSFVRLATGQSLKSQSTDIWIEGTVDQRDVQPSQPQTRVEPLVVVDYDYDRTPVTTRTCLGLFESRVMVQNISRLLKQVRVRELRQHSAVRVFSSVRLGGQSEPIPLTAPLMEYGPGLKELPGCAMHILERDVVFSYYPPRYDIVNPLVKDPDAHNLSSVVSDTELTRAAQVEEKMLDLEAERIAGEVWQHIETYPVEKWWTPALAEGNTTTRAELLGQCLEYVLRNKFSEEEMKKRLWVDMKETVEQAVAEPPSWKKMGALWEKCVEAVLKAAQ